MDLAEKWAKKIISASNEDVLSYIMACKVDVNRNSASPHGVFQEIRQHLLRTGREELIISFDLKILLREGV